MVLQSLEKAAEWMVKSPYVWLSGLWTAVVLLLCGYLYVHVGIMTAVSVAVVLAFVLPALIAGTYGIVTENASSFCIFRRYAVHGYFRCLLPTILAFLIAGVISQFISYLLLMVGMNLMASAQMAMFVFIPVVFFCYFADMTAVVNELHVFASVKDSFLRVMNGSFSVAVFYLVNVALLIAAAFIGSFVMAALAAEQFLPFASMTEAELLALTPEQMLEIMSALEIMFSGFAALAVCAVIFVPLFTLYKACYFAKTAVLVLPEVETELEGEFDEKGRWYKYK